MQDNSSLKGKSIKELEELINNLKNQLEQVQTKNNNLIKDNKQMTDELIKLKALLQEEKKLNNNLRNDNKKMNDELTKLKALLNEEQNKKNNLLQINRNLNEKYNDLEIKFNNKNNNQLVQNNSGDKEQLKLYKQIMDLNEKLKRYPYNLEENEKLISVIFTSIDQTTKYSLICKNTHSIHNIEPELYKECPDYYNSENYFLCKGKIIDKFQTLENNHIKNGDVIILNKMNNY